MISLSKAVTLILSAGGKAFSTARLLYKENFSRRANQSGVICGRNLRNLQSGGTFAWFMITVKHENYLTQVLRF